MVPPLIVKTDVALVKPKPAVADAFATVVMLIVPADILNDAPEDVTFNLLAKFIVPPSIIKLEVEAPLIELPVPVPTL